MLASLANTEPPLHALIDVGAIITGLTNEEVARQLLAHGLKHCEGCVFLDDDDTQMVLFRGDTPAVPLATVGLPRHKRFTFYDQVGLVYLVYVCIYGKSSSMTMLSLGASCYEPYLGCRSTPLGLISNRH